MRKKNPEIHAIHLKGTVMGTIREKGNIFAKQPARISDEKEQWQQLRYIGIFKDEIVVRLEVSVIFLNKR